MNASANVRLRAPAYRPTSDAGACSVTHAPPIGQPRMSHKLQTTTEIVRRTSPPPNERIPKPTPARTFATPRTGGRVARPEAVSGVSTGRCGDDLSNSVGRERDPGRRGGVAQIAQIKDEKEHNEAAEAADE